MNSQVAIWIESIKKTDQFIWWAHPIAFLLALGVIILFATWLTVIRDRLSLNKAKKFEMRGDKLELCQSEFSNIVKIWTDAIIGRAAQGHPSGVNELDIILKHRYAKGEQWIDWIRTTCTTIGLFFTFVGLGLALKELGDALQLSQNVVENNQLAELLIKVRAVLPTMGTAFASSIAGIGASLLLGLFENLLNADKHSLGSNLAELSMRWLEPGLLPMNDTRALVNISSEIRNTHTGIEKSAEINHRTLVNLERLSELFKDFPDLTKNAWKDIINDLKSWSEGSFHKGEHFIETLTVEWHDTSERLQAALTDAQSNAEEYTRSFTDMGESLRQNTGELKDFLSTMTSDLRVSATHIAALSRAAESFQDAQIESNSVINSSKVVQEKLLKDLATIFAEIPKMTQAITEASTKTAASAQKLETVILNSRMDGYIERLSDMAKFAEREIEAREQMFKVLDQLKNFGNSIAQLQINVQDIGHTSSMLGLAHEKIENQIRRVSDETLFPILEKIVSVSIKETMNSVSATQENTLNKLVQTLDRQEATVQQIISSQKASNQHQDQLAIVLARVTSAYTSPLKQAFMTGIAVTISASLCLAGIYIYSRYNNSSQEIKNETKKIKIDTIPIMVLDLKENNLIEHDFNFGINSLSPDEQKKIVYPPNRKVKYLPKRKP